MTAKETKFEKVGNYGDTLDFCTRSRKALNLKLNLLKCAKMHCALGENELKRKRKMLSSYGSAKKNYRKMLNKYDCLGYREKF